ncbi:hypothetical protein F5Y11DRAFT_132810 [Daldinia sp. FL1419]|nr:hypothetical protein F5Y11DRAFT_132810 [Daldinia sp. FL1419]
MSAVRYEHDGNHTITLRRKEREQSPDFELCAWQGLAGSLAFSVGLVGYWRYVWKRNRRKWVTCCGGILFKISISAATYLGATIYFYIHRSYTPMHPHVANLASIRY